MVEVCPVGVPESPGSPRGSLDGGSSIRVPLECGDGSGPGPRSRALRSFLCPGRKRRSQPRLPHHDKRISPANLPPQTLPGSAACIGNNTGHPGGSEPPITCAIPQSCSTIQTGPPLRCHRTLRESLHTLQPAWQIRRLDQHSDEHLKGPSSSVTASDRARRLCPLEPAVRRRWAFP